MKFVKMKLVYRCPIQIIHVHVPCELVVARLFPVTGVPLPFVSYGFNSLISVAIAFGFLHAAYRESALAEPEPVPGAALPQAGL